MRLGRAWRLVTAVVVPLLAGAALAACLVITLTAFSAQRGEFSHDVAVLHARSGADGAPSFERLVASAAAHEVGAEQAAAHAADLRREAAAAASRAGALQSSLKGLLDEEAQRDGAARRLTQKAQALSAKAGHGDLSQRWQDQALDAQMASEDATRASFIHDKQRAQEDKDKARSLLLREKELLRKSHGLVHAESKAQALFDRKKRQLKEEERKKRRMEDSVVVSAEEMPQQEQQDVRNAQKKAVHLKAQRQQQQVKHAAVQLSKSEANVLNKLERMHALEKRQAAAKDTKAQLLQRALPVSPSKHTATAAETAADRAAEKRLERPLWGSRKWPSYYDNALTDKGSKKLFAADEPSHPPPRMLEMGDDNQVFDHPRPGSDTAVPMPRDLNQARQQAMYETSKGATQRGQTPSKIGLPPAPQHVLVDRRALATTIAPAVLRKFEQDVSRIEAPVGLLERRLEATMTRMQRRSEHARALQQYATIKDEMAGLGARAQRAREMKATIAASERKRLVDTMTQEMKDVEAEMDTKLRRTVESMDVDMQHMVAEAKAEAGGIVAKADRAKIDEVGAREREMEHVMAAYVAHEKHANSALQREMRDLVDEATRLAAARSAAEQEQWKKDELAKYKQEIVSQVQKAEKKLEVARHKTALALQAERNEASMGASERLRAAEEKEQQDLSDLSKAELKEREQARVAEGEAKEEEKQVVSLQGEVHEFQARARVKQELKDERKRERQRMQERLLAQRRLASRKEAALKNQVAEARAEAVRAKEAELEREKELEVSRVRDKAMRALAMQQQQLQAAKELAHDRKVEVLRQAQFAAREAAQLRLETQKVRTQGHHAVARPAHRPVVPPARSSQGGRKFKAEVEAHVESQLRSFEKRLSAQDAAKATAIAAQAAAMKSKYQVLRSKYQAAEAMLRRKQQRLGRTVSSQIDNVYGDLGALSPHSMAMALHPVVPAVYAAGGMQKQQQHPLATASRVQERSRTSSPATTRSQELADASTIKAAQGSAEHRKLLMEAKALGFGNVHAFVEHQRRVAGGVNLSGQADAGGANRVPVRHVEDPLAMEKVREEEAAAAKPMTPKHKAFYNSGLSSDVEVPVALASTTQASFLL